MSTKTLLLVHLEVQQGSITSHITTQSSSFLGGEEAACFSFCLFKKVIICFWTKMAPWCSFSIASYYFFIQKKLKNHKYATVRHVPLRLQPKRIPWDLLSEKDLLRWRWFACASRSRAPCTSHHLGWPVRCRFRWSSSCWGHSISLEHLRCLVYFQKSIKKLNNGQCCCRCGCCTFAIWGEHQCVLWSAVVGDPQR